MQINHKQSYFIVVLRSIIYKCQLLKIKCQRQWIDADASTTAEDKRSSNQQIAATMAAGLSTLTV